MHVSEMAENLKSSEIIKIANQIKEKIKEGKKIHNLTIGDFDPKIFSLPEEFKEEIINAYQKKETNYPPPEGVRELREEISKFLKKKENLEYSPEDIIISGGGRPLIYATYLTTIDKNDKVIYSVPSWNNNHYCHLSGASSTIIKTKPENNFMPTAEEIHANIKGAVLIALCSPLNPTGTIFENEQLKKICDVILEENKKRSTNEKPICLLYDQIYWQLVYEKNKNPNPVSLRPEMKEYTIFIDGMTKAFAATGVRVGWAFGPKKVMNKMKSILSHVGAWAPKAEQIAAANYFKREKNVDQFLNSFKEEIYYRLERFYEGFNDLKKKGYNVDVIQPQASIYLTVKIDLEGQGKLKTNKDVNDYLLEEANIALIPFYCFGAEDSPWYRLSIGTVKKEEIKTILGNLENALKKLK
ncbi:pyridoxal phosphate-dependent aminotransferase [Candidatus Woesearchaeota archaeon]|nr:pyridoxal phosphate-dependent aminotransferase [Candidatus Woesearchaeota archaeon]